MRSILVLLFGGNVFGADEALLPAGLTMEDVFKPGVGTPVGKIELAQGEVVIIQKDMPDGYRAVTGLSLYQGDTVITAGNGRVRFGMIDGSILTLASSTKLIINRLDFEASKGERASFVPSMPVPTMTTSYSGFF